MDVWRVVLHSRFLLSSLSLVTLKSYRCLACKGGTCCMQCKTKQSLNLKLFSITSVLILIDAVATTDTWTLTFKLRRSLAIWVLSTVTVPKFMTKQNMKITSNSENAYNFAPEGASPTKFTYLWNKPPLLSQKKCTSWQQRSQEWCNVTSDKLSHNQLCISLT